MQNAEKLGGTATRFPYEGLVACLDHHFDTVFCIIFLKKFILFFLIKI